jgi:LPS sulfotransferase NodH
MDGVDTGYEGKFDFPPRMGPPAIPYLLASVPRTGSSWFSHLLWRTGCLGAPLEYLNFEKGGPYGFASESPDLQEQLWRSVLARRTSPNGVFGIKAFPMQLEALVSGNPALLSAVLSTLLPRGGAKRVVHLGRRDRIAHIISYARATLSGVWRKEQERGTAPEPEFDAAALETADRWLALQESAWAGMFADLGIEPLRLWYEDAIADPEGAVRQVADYLGVSIDPGAVVAVPAVERQSRGAGPDWAELYAQSRDGVEGG